jgi:hypothetical protein
MIFQRVVKALKLAFFINLVHQLELIAKSAICRYLKGKFDLHSLVELFASITTQNLPTSLALLHRATQRRSTCCGLTGTGVGWVAI